MENKELEEVVKYCADLIKQLIKEAINETLIEFLDQRMQPIQDELSEIRAEVSAIRNHMR